MQSYVSSNAVFPLGHLGDYCQVHLPQFGNLHLQWMPHNVITWRQRESINRLIAMSNLLLILTLISNRRLLGTSANIISDHINQMITLSVITLSGFHCYFIIIADCCQVHRGQDGHGHGLLLHRPDEGFAHSRRRCRNYNCKRGQTH